MHGLCHLHCLAGRLLLQYTENGSLVESLMTQAQELLNSAGASEESSVLRSHVQTLLQKARSLKAAGLPPVAEGDIDRVASDLIREASDTTPRDRGRRRAPDPATPAVSSRATRGRQRTGQAQTPGSAEEPIMLID